MASTPTTSKVPNDLKAIALAYNRPKGAQPVRVVNKLTSSSAHDPKRVKKFPLCKGQQQWKCPECEKQLSSKRSYNEHMNIHTHQRPFQCDGCEYAAASQMTLRRHILRNHTNPTDWGYKCPYCTTAYMEPASYQQHIQSRHSGRSCTYGCPFNKCTFTTKCFSHFKIHYTKHSHTDKIDGPLDASRSRTLSEDQLQLYVVDDDCGEGYRSNRPIILREKAKSKPAVNIDASRHIQYPTMIRRGGPFSDDYFGKDEFMKQPLHIKPRQTKVIMPKEKLTYLTQVTSDAYVMPANDEWIINEIEISSDNPLLSDGQNDFDLD